MRWQHTCDSLGDVCYQHGRAYLELAVPCAATLALPLRALSSAILRLTCTATTHRPRRRVGLTAIDSLIHLHSRHAQATLPR